MRVLLIHDSGWTRILWAFHLRFCGLQVTTLPGGGSTFHRAMTAGVDAVVVSLEPSPPRSVALIRELRSQTSTPIVAVGNSGIPGDATEAGADLVVRGRGGLWDLVAAIDSVRARNPI